MFDFDSLLPDGVKLYPFQTVGVATGLIERHLILGDEMGLGKTPQALVTLEAADAYPAVIVCPASLKGNWAKEASTFLPHREVFIASGPPTTTRPEITIISYNLLTAWLPVLRDFQTAIFDESHYISNPRSNRSRASIELSSRVHQDGFVMALTGTVFLNRPDEIVAQLQLIGQLHNFAPEPANPNDERAWAKSFKDYWCRDIESLRALHKALCQSCYVRRQRADVWSQISPDPYFDTKRNVVKLSLGPSLAEYREAEADLISYLTEIDGEEVAARAIISEGLARLARLRKLVGEAKIWAAQEWIDNFRLSNPDRSLVVFAYHRSVQERLVERYKCPHILGGEKDVEEQKRVFQSGEAPIIVVSLTAGREGHTLTKASDSLFVELRWVPMSQEEGRTNRIGQLRQTFAWYLHGANTVDERIWDIIERKRKLFAAGAEGKEVEASTEFATAREVLETYTHGPATRPPVQRRRLRLVR